MSLTLHHALHTRANVAHCFAFAWSVSHGTSHADVPPVLTIFLLTCVDRFGQRSLRLSPELPRWRIGNSLGGVACATPFFRFAHLFTVDPTGKDILFWQTSRNASKHVAASTKQQAQSSKHEAARTKFRTQQQQLVVSSCHSRHRCSHRHPASQPGFLPWLPLDQTA